MNRGLSEFILLDKKHQSQLQVEMRYLTTYLRTWNVETQSMHTCERTNGKQNIVVVGD